MKAIFLDRDGIINVERGQYTYLLEDFEVVDGLKAQLQRLKNLNFRLIIITNQAGIAKGIYGMSDVLACHEYLQASIGNLIDDIYIAPDHQDFSQSLSRKPDSLMLERAIAKYQITAAESWMIGDKERDLIPARKLGINTILKATSKSAYADYHIDRLDQLNQIITV